MIAGAPWGWWVGFHALVAALLVGEGILAPRRTAGLRWSWVAPAILLAVAGALAASIWLSMGKTPALEFVAGYSLELSLSIDNLFVFLVLLEGFQIGPAAQQKALLWGVGGAMVLRAAFVLAGVALLMRFAWVSWVLGALLLVAAARLGAGRSPQEVIPQWIRDLQPARGSLLPVILAVEFTDLLFATDSVPAVLSITHNPFIAYTSNVTAVLGLRALYFVLARLLERVRFLNLTLAVLLGFVGLKMVASRWIEVPVTVTLGVIGAVLAGCAVVNLARHGGS